MNTSTSRYTGTTDGGFKLLKRGINKASSIICSTMGPHKKFVFIGDKQMPLATGDGATIAKNLKFEDAWDRLGSDMLIDAAMKTEHEAGDATTTTCAVVQGIINSIPIGVNKREVCDQLIKAGRLINEMLKSKSIPVMYESDGKDYIDMKLLTKLAIISANNDIELGTMIAKLVAKIGSGGVIQVHESESDETYTEIKKGYNFKQGVLSPHFLQGGSTPLTIEHPVVLLIEEKVTDQEKLKPILKAWRDNFSENGSYKRWLVIIASDISGSAIDMLVTNYKNGVPVIAIKSPFGGEARVEAMNDLQLVTGAKNVFSQYTGNPISKFGKSKARHFVKSREFAVEEFGHCERIYVDRRETVVFFEETEHLKTKINDYIVNMDEVVLEIEERKQFYRERKSKLRNGIGHIYVGAASKTELYNKGLTVDDAQLACFAALEQGVLIGGGHTFVWLSKQMRAGYISKALLNPFNILMKNSEVSLTPWERIFLRKKISDKYYAKDKVFNVKTMEWEALNETKVLDSTKAVNSAIQNAISVSIQIIRSEYLIQWIQNS